MPMTVKKNKAPAKNGAGKSSNGRAKAKSMGPDAIKLLKSDHREVEEFFAAFENAKSPDRKAAIVGKICGALSVHAAIEEEIFYPEARAALKRAGEDLIDEAEVEHEGIKRLVEYLKTAKPTVKLYDAKVTVLKEYVQHHVKEEERELFPKVQLSDLDSEAVGAKMAERKEELTGKPVPAPKKPGMVEQGLQALLG